MAASRSDSFSRSRAAPVMRVVCPGDAAAAADRTGIKSGVMPDVINQEHRAANIILRNLDLDLVVNVAEEEYSDSVSAGYVIRSTPAEGEPLQEGDVVMLVISKGPEVIEVTVTTLTNITLEQAQKIVTELGLVCAVDYANSDTVPADNVISQSIAPLTKVAQGSTIRLTVSLGPEQPDTSEQPDNPGGEQGPADSGSESGEQPSETPVGENEGTEGGGA